MLLPESNLYVQASVDLKLKKRSFGFGAAALDGTPCWRDGRNGFWHDDACVLVSSAFPVVAGLMVFKAIDVSLNKRHYGSGPAPLDGTSCWRDGHNGFWHDDICVLVSPALFSPPSPG